MIDDLEDLMDKWREGDAIFEPWLEEEEENAESEPDYGPETCASEEDCEEDEDGDSNESSSSDSDEDGDYEYLEEPEAKLLVRPDKKFRFL